MNLMLFFNPFMELANWITDQIMGPLRYIWGEILKFFYSLWATMASVIDGIQVLFQMLVGTHPVHWLEGSGMGGMAGITEDAMTQGIHTNNMLLDIFLSEYVLSAFWKVLILSVFLLLIFVIIAIVKNEYSTNVDGTGDPKKPYTLNNKMYIIKRAVKALISFLCVPLACMFGVIASGYLMQALDAATSVSGDASISNKMFEVCARDANRVRSDYDFYLGLSKTNSEDGESGYNLSNGANKFSYFAVSDREDLADAVDDCFVFSKPLPSGVSFDEGDNFANFWDNGGGMNDQNYFNTKNTAQVFYYYDLTRFEWLIGLFTIFYVGTLLIKIVLGAAVRLYELAILFIISPAIIAISPLDNEGKTMGNWQKAFIGKTIMIFAPVIAINLYFVLVATLTQVDISASLASAASGGSSATILGATESIVNVGAGLLQMLYELFITIAGLVLCEKSMKMLGDLIGADDMLDAADKFGNKVKDIVTTSAAGKYLLSKGGQFKGGLANVGSSATGQLKNEINQRMHDRFNRDEVQGINLQKQAAFDKKNSDTNNNRKSFDDASMSSANHNAAKNQLRANLQTQTGMDMSDADMEKMKQSAMTKIDEYKNKYANDSSLTAEQKMDKIYSDMANDMKLGNDATTEAFKDYIKEDAYSALAKDVADWRAKEDEASLEAHKADLENTINEVRAMSAEDLRNARSSIVKDYKDGTINDATIQGYLKNTGEKLNAYGVKSRAGLGQSGYDDLGVMKTVRRATRSKRGSFAIEKFKEGYGSAAKKDDKKK